MKAAKEVVPIGIVDILSASSLESPVRKDYYNLDMAVFVSMCLLAIALLAGCQSTYSPARPHVYKRSSTVPRRPVTYLVCDESGCRRYDSAGVRRHDLERP